MAYQASIHEILPFCYSAPGVGTLQLRALDLDRDLFTLHDWLTRDYARFWGMLTISRDELRAELTPTIHKRCLMGELDGRPAFMTELYDPAEDEIGNHYPCQSDDCGMHFILAPPQGHGIRGFSLAVLRTILDFVFSQSNCTRVVVEPDLSNEKIHHLNDRVGFRTAKVARLENKTALLGLCTQKSFHDSHQATSPGTSAPTTDNMENIRHERLSS